MDNELNEIYYQLIAKYSNQRKILVNDLNSIQYIPNKFSDKINIYDGILEEISKIDNKISKLLEFFKTEDELNQTKELKNTEND